jgi:hypothetical protein
MKKAAEVSLKRLFVGPAEHCPAGRNQIKASVFLACVNREVARF